MSYYQWDGKNILLDLTIQPNAAKNEVVGPYGDSLKIRIQSLPVDGKANKALIKVMSTLFLVKKSNIVMISGETSRKKKIKIINPAIDHLPEFIKS